MRICYLRVFDEKLDYSTVPKLLKFASDYKVTAISHSCIASQLAYNSLGSLQGHRAGEELPSRAASEYVYC